MCKVISYLQMTKPILIAVPAPPADPAAEDLPAADEAGLQAAAIARVEHRLGMLDELAELALKMARGVAEQSLAAKADPAESAKADAPPAGAVRLTLDLAGRLEESLRALRA